MALDGQSLLSVAIALTGAALVWANLWRALIFLMPSAITLEIEDGSPDAPVPGWLENTHSTLCGLGFAPVGSWLERRRLGPTRTSWGYVNESQRTFAIASDAPLVRVRRSALTPPEPRLEREGPSTRVTFLTVTTTSGFLLSSNFRRPGATIPSRHLCAGLPNAPPERLYRAHLRRVEELGQPAGTFTLEGLLSHLRGWHLSVGRPELRRQHAVGMLWTLGGLGMVIGPLVGRY
jgi:hypothetical protein